MLKKSSEDKFKKIFLSNSTVKRRIHHQALASKTLYTELREDLNLVSRVVNYVKSSTINSRLFTMLCDDLETKHKILLFNTEVHWLSKGNMLRHIFEMKEEVALYLEYGEKE
jgi:hypothetical protein